MLILRSAAFNVAFYLNLFVWFLIALPTLLLPRAAFMAAARQWTRISLWLLRAICGTRMEVRGREYIPPGGFLVACKHQSLWETFALFMVFEDPAFVIKRELQWIPFYGWFTLKARSIPVNRKGGSPALAAMNRRALEEAATGRQIVIFPEGTRRAAGAPPAYKYGIAHMYEQMGLPCVPVALNSGLFWPRRRFLRHPGTIVVEIAPPLPPGLPRDTFFARMQEEIESRSAALLAEGLRQTGRAAPLHGPGHA
jgi:1-acyl-sn-glycerol-3-phosphate acyltransferase